MMQGAFPYFRWQILILGKSLVYYVMNNSFRRIKQPSLYSVHG